MRSLLNPENPVMRFLTKIGYTIILNLLWFLCSLPLFTIGASTTALYAVMQKLVRNEESGIASAFFTALDLQGAAAHQMQALTYFVPSQTVDKVRG